jgi:hypothetical protein
VRTESVDDRGRYRFADLVPGEYFVVAVQGIASDEDLSELVLEELSRHAMRAAIAPGESHVTNLRGLVGR